MAITRKATAVWKGKIKEGAGKLNTPNHFFHDTPYSFKGRFKNEDGSLGTNPEELIAAAHSGCYAMALSLAITEAGFTPDELNAQAHVKLEQVEDGFSITGITLQVEGKVSGMKEGKFMELAQAAKEGCPVSKALGAVPIDLEAKFVS